MGVLAKIRRMFGGGRLAKSIPSSIVVYPDGFFPALEFNNSAMQTLYEATAWSYACIARNSMEAASLGAMVQVKDSDGVWVRSSDVPQLSSFLQHPSGMPPSSGLPKPPHWSWSQLVFLMAAHMYLDGDGFLVPNIVNSGKRLWSVAPLLPNEVRTNTDKTGYPIEYTIGAKKYQADQIVHFMWTSPLSFSEGHAPIKAALRAINIDYQASLREKHNLENKVAPGMIISVSGFLGMTNAQRDDVIAYLQENYQGATKEGNPLVLGEGASLLNPKLQQQSYENLRKGARQEIMSVFGTPPPLLGIYDNATLNNFAQAFKLWWLSSLFPLLKNTYDTLNTQLIHPIYGPDVRIWYDDAGSEIALLLLKERAETAQTLVNMGFPPNIAVRRASIDIERVEALDVPLQNLALAGRTNGDTEE